MEGKGKVGLLSICQNHCIGLLAIISVVIQSRITSAQTVFPTDGETDLTTTKFLFTTTEQGLSLRPIIVDCPENVSWPILMGQLGTNVNWTEPTAVQRNESLGSDGIFVIRPKEGPGTYFSAAETHVIRYLFQSSDANVIVCEFPILFDVLEDTEEPDVDCPPDVNINVPFSQPFDFVSWSEPTATDNSGVVSFVGSSHSPNTAFPVGVTNVTYTYQDPSGLNNSCTFSVAVISNELDTESPNITNCPDRDIIVIALSSEGGKNVTWRPPEVTDNSGNVTLTSVTPTPGSFFEFGETAIGYVFTDPSDNSAFCPIFTIAVVEVPDEQDPCRSSPCKDGSTCELDASDNGYRCYCGPGLSGDNCDVCLQGRLTGCPVRAIIEVATDSRTVLTSFEAPTALFQDSGDITTAPITNTDDDIEEGFPVGMTKVTYRAGCLKCVASIIIIDTTPPNITFCPENIEDVLEGETTKSIEWAEPVVRDYQEGPLLNTSTHVPGDLFGQGITRVTYTYTDEACNQAICSFTITLNADNDTTPPRIFNCPVNGIQALVPAGVDGRIVSWRDLVIYDMSNITISPSHSPGDFFLVGEEEVSYVIMDDNGNRAECNFTVTVNETDQMIDDTATFTDCPKLQRISAPEHNNLVNVFWQEPKLSSSNNISQFQVIQTHHPGDPIQIGETTVRYTAVNVQSGSTAECSFTIAVIDMHVPVIHPCPDFVRVRSCRRSVIANWQIPMATDNSMKEITVREESGAVPGRTRFPQGRGVVSYTAMDEAFNLAVCRFAVEVHMDDCSPIPSIIFTFVGGLIILLLCMYLIGSTIHCCRRRKIDQSSPDTDRIQEEQDSSETEADGSATLGDVDSSLQRIPIQDETLEEVP